MATRRTLLKGMLAALGVGAAGKGAWAAADRKQVVLEELAGHGARVAERLAYNVEQLAEGERVVHHDETAPAHDAPLILVADDSDANCELLREHSKVRKIDSDRVFVNDGTAEVWLFDKNDIRTVTKVLRSEHAYRDEALKSNLRSRYGSDIAVDLQVDPDILGGLVVKVGSQMIDGSIRTKLNTLAQAMKG